MNYKVPGLQHLLVCQSPGSEPDCREVCFADRRETTPPRALQTHLCACGFLYLYGNVEFWGHRTQRRLNPKKHSSRSTALELEFLTNSTAHGLFLCYLLCQAVLRRFSGKESAFVISSQVQVELGALCVMGQPHNRERRRTKAGQ